MLLEPLLEPCLLCGQLHLLIQGLALVGHVSIVIISMHGTILSACCFWNLSLAAWPPLSRCQYGRTELNTVHTVSLCEALLQMESRFTRTGSGIE